MQLPGVFVRRFGQQQTALAVKTVAALEASGTEERQLSARITPNSTGVKVLGPIAILQGRYQAVLDWLHQVAQRRAGRRKRGECVYTSG